jgi:RNA polymerase sigma factor (sigma-70 family)
MDDGELLQEYVERQSERAFAELVARHVNFVYATARRVVGEGAPVEDVVQTVFIRLARKAWSIRDGNALPGWLYRAAYRAACETVRGEQRRRRREAEAVSLSEQNAPDATGWAQVVPLLDDAMRRLSRAEQDAVALRYFRGKSLRETGEALGTSEAAAQMRVTRGLEKMREHFRRRGCTVAAGVLAMDLATHTSLACPPGLAANVTQNALAGAAKAGLVNAAAKFIYMSTKTKIIMVATVVTALALIPLERQHEEIVRLQEQLAAGQIRTIAGMAYDAAGTSGAAGAHAMGANPGRNQGPSAAVARAAFVKILSQPGDVTRMRGLLNLADSVDEQSIPQILQAISQMPDSELKAHAAQIFIRRWAELDPAEALAIVNKLPGAQYRLNGLLPVFDAMLEKDPQSAENALEQIDDPKIRGAMQLHILNEVALSNPQASFGFLQSMSADAQSSDLYGAVFTAWAMNDPVAAASAATGLSSGKYQDTALATVAASWVHQDSQAATAWAESLPAGSGQNSAVEGIAGAWTRSNPTASWQWINTLPQGDTRDGAVIQWVENEGTSDPGAALSAATTLSNAETQQKVLSTIAEKWGQADAGAAATAIQGADLPEAQKSNLLQIVQSATKAKD